MEKLRKTTLKASSRRKTTLRVDFDYDFGLVGVVSPVRDYRIAWQLNRFLQMDLHREDDLEISGGKNLGKAWYSRFAWQNMVDKSRFYLISNRFSGEYLIPERKKFDFFLVVHGTLEDSSPDKILKAIKPIPDIQTALLIEPGALRSRINLILE